MGDSDDEHERSRGRDKFRRERSDYGSSEKGRSSRNDSYRDSRRTWRDDRRRPREEFEEDSRRRYSSPYGRAGGRDWSPPSKRPRRDWDPLRDFSSGMMAPYGMRPPWSMPPPGPRPPVPSMLTGLPGSPSTLPQAPGRHVMLTFKQFLAQQDDSIDEVDAIASYNEYKDDFKRKQVEEFFEKHKEEDWFMTLYHPTNLATAKEAAAANLRSRVEAFLFILSSGRISEFPLSVTSSEQIIRTMDTAVIKMEGGNEADLQTLDMSSDEEEEEEEEKESHSKSKDQSEGAEVAENTKRHGTKRKREDDESDTSSLANDRMEPEAERDKTPLPDEDSTPPPSDMAEPKTTNGKMEEGQDEENNNGKPRFLHMTRSVYIRHIPPRISAEDIMKLCRNMPGYLRIAFADATADKGYERRGWVTYTRDTDIKEVSGLIGAAKIKETQLSCSVNRELTRRVKHAPAATWTRKAVHSDLHNAIKLVKFWDEKNQLWEYSQSDDNQQTNPVLNVDESFLREDEEAEPVAMGDDEEGAITELSSTDVLDAETDPKLKILEHLLWYLRVVHSLDYYNGMVFPSEDNMPHRCGIFTVRSKPPVAVTSDDMTSYCKEIEEKVSPLLSKKKELTESEMEKFGKKNPDAEAEQFIEMNTQKISDNKYLCPLSGKKFKGPEFVKKHIFNKHMDKVEAVKKEAEFFNNYIRDPDRPMPLEASIKSSVLPPNPKTPSADDASPSMISPMGVPPGPGGPPSAWGQEAQMMMFARGGGAGFGGMRGFSGLQDRDRGGRRGGRRGRGRRQVDYRDLDAPDAEEIY